MSAMSGGGPARASAGIPSNWREHAQPGMTMRQAYKIAALQGALANSALSDTKGTVWMVGYAAELADAMLAEDAQHASHKGGEAI